VATWPYGGLSLVFLSSERERIKLNQKSRLFLHHGTSSILKDDRADATLAVQNVMMPDNMNMRQDFARKKLSRSNPKRSLFYVSHESECCRTEVQETSYFYIFHGMSGQWMEKLSRTSVWISASSCHFPAFAGPQRCRRGRALQSDILLFVLIP